MAKTRGQIKTSVDANTGRGTEKATLIESLCDEALKVAINQHPFRDAQNDPTIIAITEDAVSVDISAITNLVHIVTARIIQDSGSLYSILFMRDRAWWDRNIVNPADNQKGWPKNGLRWESTVLLERPAESDLQLQLIVSQEKTFTDDSTESPVKILDTFITQYVTAFVFLSIQNMESYAYWKNISLGFKWDEGIVGGTLGHAIRTDKFDISEEMVAQGPGSAMRKDGVAILNGLINYDLAGNPQPHDRFGQVDTWY